MDTKQITYLATLLTKLKEAKVLDDPKFFTYLADLSNNSQDAETNAKANQDSSALIGTFSNRIQGDSSNDPKLIEKSKRLYVDGCFDLMHSGHFNAIRQAKALGEFLVIGVVSDVEVEAVKGPTIMTENERKEIAAACKWGDEVADCVIPYNPTIELIDSLNCQYVAHGDDLAPGADGKDCYYEIKQAKRMKIFKRTEGISTTDILGRLLRIAKIEAAKEGTDGKALEESKHDAKETVVSPVKFIQTGRRLKSFISGRVPSSDDKVVYVDGSFDLIHLGHVRFLKKVRELGTYVIVGVHDDDAIAKRKGSHYPVLSLQERILSVLSLRYVDDIIIGAPAVVDQSLLNTLNVSVVAEGKISVGTHGAVDPYEVPKSRGIYKVVETDTNYSSAIFRKKILENQRKYEEIFQKKKAKQEKYYEADMDTNLREIN